MKPSLLAAVLALTLPGLALSAAKQTGEATATFNGSGPAGFKLEGKSTEVTVKDEGDKVTIIVPLAKLDTGIELRNRHMSEKYLETDKYPDAVLVIDRASITLPEDGKTVEGKGKGKMTLHGKTRDVAFKYVLARAGNIINATGNVPLNIKEFDINIPSYLGVTVKPNIETTVKFSFTE